MRTALMIIGVTMIAAAFYVGGIKTETENLNKLLALAASLFFCGCGLFAYAKLRIKH